MTHSEIQPHDPVAHPHHYTFGTIEVIDAIEAWALGFHLGNVVKYLARAAHKGRYLEDLRKARWYLDREIKRAQEADAEAQSFMDVRSVDPSADHSTRDPLHKRFCT